MTTKGDNKSHATGESLRLVIHVASRLPEIQQELRWALGKPVSEVFKKPPLWVRRLVRQLVDSKSGSDDSLSSMDLARLTGFIAGVAHSSRAALANLSKRRAAAVSKNETTDELLNQLGEILAPSIENLSEKFGQGPPSLVRTKPELFVTHSEAQTDIAKKFSAMVNCSNSPMSATDEVKFALWGLWPQISTASSVSAVHSWLNELGFTKCSEKLVQKICTEIGFRPSRRGRPRIPKKST